MRLKERRVHKCGEIRPDFVGYILWQVQSEGNVASLLVYVTICAGALAVLLLDSASDFDLSHNPSVMDQLSGGIIVVCCPVVTWLASFVHCQKSVAAAGLSVRSTTHKRRYAINIAILGFIVVIVTGAMYDALSCQVPERKEVLAITPAARDKLKPR